MSAGRTRRTGIIGVAVAHWLLAIPGAMGNEISVGVGYLDDNEIRVMDWAGLDGAGARFIGDLRLSGGVLDGERGYWTLTGQGLGLDTFGLDLSYGVQGRYRLRVEYRELDSRQSTSSASPFSRSGDQGLTLPAGWVAAPTTAGMTSLEESLRATPLGITRKTARMSWQQVFSDAWSMQGNLRWENRRGTRPMAGTMGSTGGNSRAALLAAPLDYTTRDIEVQLDYARRNGVLRSGYRLSVFDNDDSALRWQNPFAAVAGWVPGTGHPAGFGQLALEPDNQLHQVFTSGAWRLRPDLRLNGEVQLGRLRQDETFLPYTINPAVSVTTPLPRSDLDGRVDTRRVDLRLQYTPAGRFSSGLGYRFDERDNDTPRDLYIYVGGDSRDQDTSLAVSRARNNLPYGFRRESLDAHAGWRWRNGTRLRGEARRRETRRDFAEVDTTRDDSLKLRLSGTGAQFGFVDRADAHRWRWHVEGTAERRHGDDYRGSAPWLATHTPEYVETVPEDLRFVNHPLLRRYYLADRDRRGTRAGLQWVATDTLVVGLGGNYLRDEYDDSELGLTGTRTRSVTADLGWSPGEGHNLDLWLSRDLYDSEQNGWSFRGTALRPDLADPERRWEAAVRDRIDSAGLGWRRTGLRPGLDGGIDYVWSLGRSSVSTRTGTSLTNAPVPETVSRIQRLDLYLTYQIDERISVRGGWLHERGRITDWAYQGVAADTVATVLGLGETQPSYQVNWFTLRLQYRLE